MITIDTSVVVKWFKPGERFETEALDLLGRIGRGEVVAAANEIISLEVVRGLKNAQTRQPALGMTDIRITRAFQRLEGLFAGGAMLECTVADIKPIAKDVQMALGLFVADAVHLATAVYLGARYFVVDDHHFLASSVVAYALANGTHIMDLPALIAALNAPPASPSAPTP